MFFNKLKIGQRLTLGFASVLALLLVLTALAWNGLRNAQAATERVAVLEHRAAVTAVEQWRFRPASQGGRAVTGSTDVTVRFVLTD